MIKEIAVAMWEISHDDVLNLPTSTPVLTYNTWAKTYGIGYNIPGNYVRDKVTAKHHKFFCFDNPVESSFEGG